jgi:hypothetical protein
MTPLSAARLAEIEALAEPGPTFRGEATALRVAIRDLLTERAQLSLLLGQALVAINNTGFTRAARLEFTARAHAALGYEPDD